MIFSKFENLLKTISDDSIQHPKGHPSIPGKSQNFQFFQFWAINGGKWRIVASLRGSLGSFGGPFSKFSYFRQFLRIFERKVEDIWVI